MSYYEHWETEEENEKNIVNKYSEDQGRLRMIEYINQSIKDLFPFLIDINSLSVERLSADNFAEIKNAIKQRIEEINES
jgi:hypothetical protein